jgi:hypothetical protein
LEQSLSLVREFQLRSGNMGSKGNVSISVYFYTHHFRRETRGCNKSTRFLLKEVTLSILIAPPIGNSSGGS